jgi:hypothetical protein
VGWVRNKMARVRLYDKKNKKIKKKLLGYRVGCLYGNVLGIVG